MTDERGSSWKARSALKLPAWIQEKRFFMMGRCSWLVWSNPIKEITDTTKEAKTAKQAWKEMYLFGSFCPKRTRMRVLRAGINGISQK
jgi:hypothetical protein